MLALIGATVVVAACVLLLAARRERAVASESAPSGRLVTAGDVRIFLQEAGPPDGPPVVLVHGTGAWSETWRATLAALAAAGWHAVALDLPATSVTPSVRRAGATRSPIREPASSGSSTPSARRRPC